MLRFGAQSSSLPDTHDPWTMRKDGSLSPAREANTLRPEPDGKQLLCSRPAPRAPKCGRRKAAAGAGGGIRPSGTRSPCGPSDSVNPGSGLCWDLGGLDRGAGRCLSQMCSPKGVSHGPGKRVLCSKRAFSSIVTIQLTLKSSDWSVGKVRRIRGDLVWMSESTFVYSKSLLICASMKRQDSPGNYNNICFLIRIRISF